MLHSSYSQVTWYFSQFQVPNRGGSSRITIRYEPSVAYTLEFYQLPRIGEENTYMQYVYSRVANVLSFKDLNLKKHQ